MMHTCFFFRNFYTSLPLQKYKAAKAKNTPKKGFYLAAIQY